MASLQNQNFSAVIDNTQIMIVNQTTVPPQQTSVTFHQITPPGECLVKLKPIESQSMPPQAPNLANIVNTTMVQSIDPATTIPVKETAFTYNQTNITIGNSTKLSQPHHNSKIKPVNHKRDIYPIWRFRAAKTTKSK